MAQLRDTSVTGALTVNGTNVMNTLAGKVDSSKIIDSLSDVVANTQNGMPVGAKAIAELNNNLNNGFDNFQRYSFSSLGTDIMDALMVDLNNSNSVYNRTGNVCSWNAGTVNMPPGCDFGVREVSWVNYGFIVVRVTGYMNAANNYHRAIWINVYVNNNWMGWEKVTLSSEIKSFQTTLFYSSSTVLSRTVTVGNEWNGHVLNATIITKSQTPYSQTNRILTSTINNGQVTITAQGSGYVNGHVILVGCIII